MYGESCLTSTSTSKCTSERTWSDSFIIDSHVIIVLRHRRCVCVCVCASHGFASAPSIYLLNVTDRHMRDRLNHNTHIIYEHMFCSCWSFAITLTTWSVAIARRCRQQMTWYRQCSLTYDTKAIRFSWFDIYLVGRIISVDWKRWEFAYVDKFGKVFFSQHFFPHFVNVSVQLFNS